ncbi:MAG: hypothetical protein EPN99_03585 [Frankiales bacterium]|nr:MAG: hypothetical protein EPN99_03585 [Frankiales bacterium]
MSVLMTLRVAADATRLESLAKKDPTLIPAVAAKGKKMGASYHRFYATDSEILVVDVWPDEESFHAFFASTPEIPVIMEEAGVTTAPEITMWRKLDLGDDIG